MYNTPFVGSLLETGLGYAAFELSTISPSMSNEMQTQYKSGWCVLFCEKEGKQFKHAQGTTFWFCTLHHACGAHGQLGQTESWLNRERISKESA